MAGMMIEVDTQQLERDKNAISEGLYAVQQSLKKVYAQMDELDAMWEGPANEVFRYQFANDRQQFEMACTEVSGLITSLTFAKTEYEKCEGQVNTAVASIKV